jgi:hypothetical protein
MKKWIVIGTVVSILSMWGLMWTLANAGEREELQWKARALVAEANLFQSKLSEAQKTIQEFLKELDSKGYMATQDGTIIEKPKPPALPVAPADIPKLKEKK